MSVSVSASQGNIWPIISVHVSGEVPGKVAILTVKTMDPSTMNLKLHL